MEGSGSRLMQWPPEKWRQAIFATTWESSKIAKWSQQSTFYTIYETKTSYKMFMNLWRKNEMILCIVVFPFLTPFPSPSWLSLWKMTRVRGLVSMRGTGRPSVHKLGERGTDQEMMKGIKTSARDKTACPKSLDGVAMKFYCKNSPTAFKSPPQSVLKL